jgi:hypothetical protein
MQAPLLSESSCAEVRPHTHNELCADWHNVKAEFDPNISMWLFIRRLLTIILIFVRKQ